ncbi:hypothetical protein [Peristeroidobacter agariperforans]|uniref:hypothetical protein n=1 Tax=Peristeroidobacter agariperforans TaxID=268404 RepID=UPI00101C2E2A|nr:hypothetical protein [Peristeroidobacter agariperforans]
MTRSLFALALLAVTSSAAAVPVNYIFDSISRIELGPSRIYLSGIIKGETTKTDLNWANAANDSGRSVNRCVPIFLTMLEKPGRYVLHLQFDPEPFNPGTLNCGLELKD